MPCTCIRGRTVKENRFCGVDSNIEYMVLAIKSAIALSQSREYIPHYLYRLLPQERSPTRNRPFPCPYIRMAYMELRIRRERLSGFPERIGILRYLHVSFHHTIENEQSNGATYGLHRQPQLGQHQEYRKGRPALNHQPLSSRFQKHDGCRSRNTYRPSANNMRRSTLRR
jgi:hypothetical protein